MNIELRAKVDFRIPLREPHVLALLELSRVHYDARCRLAGAACGFLVGWKRQIDSWTRYEEEEKHKTISATFDELDICLKIMEVAYLLRDYRYGTVIADLRTDFIGATRLANDKYHEWTITYASERLFGNGKP
jgi:hypothetical protein